MKKAKICSRVATLALMAAMLVPTAAHAATYSTVIKKSVGGVTYYGQTSTSVNGTYVVGRCGVDASKSVGAGYIYTHQKLIGNGSLKAESSGYTQSASAGGSTSRSAKGESGMTYYTTGDYKAFNPSSGSYVASGSLTTPSLRYGATRSAGIDVITGEKPLAMAYERTENGETFGSAIGEEEYGFLPDWISAEATNGMTGYIDRADYWVPIAENPSDAVKNFSSERVRSIPVYAEPGGGAVVGEYEMYYGGDISQE